MYAKNKKSFSKIVFRYSKQRIQKLPKEQKYLIEGECGNNIYVYAKSATDAALQTIIQNGKACKYEHKNSGDTLCGNQEHNFIIKNIKKVK